MPIAWPFSGVLSRHTAAVLLMPLCLLALSLLSFRDCTCQMSQICSCLTFDLDSTTVTRRCKFKILQELSGRYSGVFCQGAVVCYQRLWRRVNSQLCSGRPVATAADACSLVQLHSYDFLQCSFFMQFLSLGSQWSHVLGDSQVHSG